MGYRIFRFSILALAAAFSFALAVPTVQAKDQYHFKFLPSEGQKLFWSRGVPSIDSFADESIVRVVDSKDRLPDDQTTFRITVLNIGEEAINVNPDDVWIEDANGSRVVMLSFEELEGRHRRDIKRRQALAAIGGALSAGSANGYTSGSFNYSGTTSNGTYFNGFGTYSAYDSNLALQQRQAAAAQSQATFNAIQVRQLGGVEALNGMLRQTTLEPGQVTSGILAFDLPRDLRRKVGKGPVTIVVRLGSADHRFQVELAELE